MDDKRYQLADDVFFDENVEGIFLLSGSGDVYVLEDDVSKAVWNLFVEAPRSIAEVQRHIRQQFAIQEADPVEEDARDFITALEKIGVLCEWEESMAKTS